MNEVFGTNQHVVFGETEHITGLASKLGIRSPSRTDCHGGHCVEVRTFDGHHVVAKSEGGETSPENLAIICPNTHRNAHDLYRLYDEYNGSPPRGLVSFPRIVRRMAKARWTAVQRGLSKPLDQDWRLP